MQNFDFQNPTRIVFGEGTIAQLSTLVPPTARCWCSTEAAA